MKWGVRDAERQENKYVKDVRIARLSLFYKSFASLTFFSVTSFASLTPFFFRLNSFFIRFIISIQHHNFNNFH